MTDLPPPSFLATPVADGGETVALRLEGDLDYDTSEDLLGEVDRLLGERGPDASAGARGVRELRLDCSGLRTCDSMGLSTLLQVHRRSTAAGIRLHLDNRTPSLERLLDITGTLAHFTEHPGADAS